MVFGDNVRARRAARALPRTPTQRGKGGEERKKGRGEDRATRPHTHHTAAIPQPTTHDGFTASTRHHRLSAPTQTVTAIPQ
nr:MAG TPA: hypothetical protein [Caudoviricetes sp.]